MKLITKLFLLLIITFILLPMIALANTSLEDIFFKARVLEITETKKVILSDGIKIHQQNIKLIGIEDDFKNKEIFFNGIQDYDVVNKNIYKIGDTVLVAAIYDHKGIVKYYITDYVRTKSLKILFIIFLIAIIAIGKWKGLRSILSLGVSFLIIMQFIIPKILAGLNPIAITLIGSLAIFSLVLYLTEGIKPISHISIISVAISLVITIVLSWIFVEWARLTGLSNEETGSLINLAGNTINFKGLLLAGIIIGALGVLDDVVIAQAAAVLEIHKTNKNLSKKELFSKAYRIGVSHISSMTNTLFLAYTGVSLPLIILFTSGESAFNNFGQLVNNEDIATEIIRTLSGSIGLILAVPIATGVAVWWAKKTTK